MRKEITELSLTFVGIVIGGLALFWVLLWAADPVGEAEKHFHSQGCTHYKVVKGSHLYKCKDDEYCYAEKPVAWWKTWDQKTVITCLRTRGE